MSSYSVLADSNELDLIDFLHSLDSYSIRHSAHHSLASHLLGTYGILNEVDAPRHVALAGGLHSLYGTIRFPRAVLDADNAEHRQMVRQRFGAQAELLTHTFCTINRPMGVEYLDQTVRRQTSAYRENTEQLIKDNSGRITDFIPLPTSWQQGGEPTVEAVQLEEKLVQPLRLLDAVNMIEQGEEHSTLTKLPNILRVWKEHLAAHPLPSNSPLFVRFFHFSHADHMLPCVKLTNAVVADFDSNFHNVVLGLIPSVDRNVHRISHLRLLDRKQTTDAKNVDEMIAFSADELSNLSSNAPNNAYELVLSPVSLESS